ncbi:MAG: hypothetical protein ACOC80_07490 [Petrotogales bacterium]
MKYTNLIEKFDEGLILIWQDEWEKHHPRKSHYVTDISLTTEHGIVGSCLRKQFYDWKEYKPTDLNPTRILYTEVGKILHKHLFKRVFERAGLKVEDELELENRIDILHYPVHGRIDQIINNSIMLEIKTTQGKGITNKHFGVKYNGAKETQKIQLAYYRDYWKDAFEEYVFFFFGRDNFYRTAFLLDDREEYDWNAAYVRWHELEYYLKRNVLPLPDYDTEKFPCSWCIYQSQCKKDSV